MRRGSTHDGQTDKIAAWAAPCRRRKRIILSCRDQPTRGIVTIALEFIDVVIPIAKIRESYPGGWEQCLADYTTLIGRRVWYDRHLFRDGAMDRSEARTLVEGWAVLGFEPIGTRREGQYWKDLCVVEWRRGGPTRPCDWLAFDPSTRTAHLAGTEPGPLVWRGQPRPNGTKEERDPRVLWQDGPKATT